MALSRSRCSWLSSASFARRTTSSGLVTSLDIAQSDPRARFAGTAGRCLAPALLCGPIIADQVERATDDLVDEVRKRVRFGIEGRQRRQDDRAHFGKLRQGAQMPQM